MGNSSATAGVQKNDSAFDQYFCDGSGGAATGGQSYILQSCGTPTPTPTGYPKCYAHGNGYSNCNTDWNAHSDSHCYCHVYG